jgi:NAD(P)-dependent dehydrogenase (short-subunit alcohol dehydrogenase family)
MNDLFSLKGKTAVITGGSRGIGFMIANGYADAGAKKIYISSRKAADLEAAAAEISKKTTCVAIPADLSTEEGAKVLADAIRAEEDGIDILVNNAGATWGAPFEEFPASGWDRVLDINVKGPFFLTQALLPLLEAAASDGDPARIINVGSVDGLNVSRMPTFSYGPSKAAVHHLTRALASHLASRNITANAIAPGPFPSKMMEHTLNTMGDQIRQGVPLGRVGEPADMAGAAIYLASRAGAYVDGVVIPVDGGIIACAGTL